jgi:hypothetical protein
MFSSRHSGSRRAPIGAVSCLRAAGILLVLLAVLLVKQSSAATLEQLSFDEMTAQATDIVYGLVLGSHVAVKGDSIYTHYSVQVQERWKGNAQLVMDVVLPGGVSGGLRQSFAGVPQLDIGRQYAMSLWTGASGRTQLIGLTQGLFDVEETTAGELIASRGRSSELMLDRSGKAVQDQAVRMPMREMSSRVKRAAARGKVPQ